MSHIEYFVSEEILNALGVCPECASCKNSVCECDWVLIEENYLCELICEELQQERNRIRYLMEHEVVLCYRLGCVNGEDDISLYIFKDGTGCIPWESNTLLTVEQVQTLLQEKIRNLQKELAILTPHLTHHSD